MYLTKYVQYLYKEKYKILTNGITEQPNKRRDIYGQEHSILSRCEFKKKDMSSKMIYKFNTIPVKVKTWEVNFWISTNWF